MIFQLRPLTDTITKFSSFFLPRGRKMDTIFSFITPFSFHRFPALREGPAAPPAPCQLALSSPE